MILRNINRFGAVAGVLILYFLVGCEPSQKAWAPKPGTIEYKIAQIGDGAVAAHYPKYNREKFPVRIVQRNDRWYFDYALPDNMIGGTPTVEIDKSTLKVIKIYEAQ